MINVNWILLLNMHLINKFYIYMKIMNESLNTQLSHIWELMKTIMNNRLIMDLIDWESLTCSCRRGRWVNMNFGTWHGHIGNIYIYTYVCIYICIYVLVCVYIICVYTYVYMYLCVYILYIYAPRCSCQLVRLSYPWTWFKRSKVVHFIHELDKL